MACDCIKNFEKLLKEKLNDSAIVNSAMMENGTIRVVVNGMYHKKNKKGQYQQKYTNVNLLAKYCPFCGKPYDKKEENEL